MRHSIILCGTICGLFLADAGATALHMPAPFSVQTAEAQQMGKQPWSPAPRNRSLSAQFEHSDRQLRESNRNGNGMAALQHFVETYTYNSSSTSIGNLNEIYQMLSDGSTGMVHQATDQNSQGNQGSAANTEVAVDSQTNSTSSAATNTSNGAGNGSGNGSQSEDGSGTDSD